MLRFWDAAEAAPSGDGFAILLDGRPMRLPGGGPLHVAGQSLAVAIAAEWRAAGGAKGGTMTPADVPLTRLAGTAADRIAPDPHATITALARYGETELLCYRTQDPRLAPHQAAQWDPWLLWSAHALHATLLTTTGVMPVTRPPAALFALHAALATKPPLALAALGVAVPALGSLVLALAMEAGAVSAQEAHALSALEEDFHREIWGDDPDILARRAAAAADVALAARLLALLDP